MILLNPLQSLKYTRHTPLCFMNSMHFAHGFEFMKPPCELMRQT